MDPEMLKEILDGHMLWLKCEGGVPANLRGANLDSANLDSANLIGANLDSANLDSANLRGANLIGANLIGANLDSANLDSANLRGANLDSANLDSANLIGAKRAGHILLNAPILFCGGFGSGNRTTLAFCIAESEGSLWIECGCWSGTIAEFRVRIKATHQDTPISKEYLLMCDLLEVRRARLPEEISNGSTS
jgi:hypothetical protein